jgi:hypothetical protein
MCGKDLRSLIHCFSSLLQEIGTKKEAAQMIVTASTALGSTRAETLCTFHRIRHSITEDEASYYFEKGVSIKLKRF